MTATFPDVLNALAERARKIKELILSPGNEPLLAELQDPLKNILEKPLDDKQLADFCAQVFAFSQYLEFVASNKEKNLEKVTPASDFASPNFDLTAPIGQIRNIIRDSGILPLERVSWDNDFENVPLEGSLDAAGITAAYEVFLDAYDKHARNALGSFYTPEPIADFIVRSVDWLLRTAFALPYGLCDSSVEILDPASGTQVFLCAALRFLFTQVTAGDKNVLDFEEISQNFLRRYMSYEYHPPAFAIGTFNVLSLVTTLGGPENPRLLSLNGRIRDTLAQFEDDMAIMSARNLAGSLVQVVWGNPPYKKDAKAGSAGLALSLKAYQDPVRSEKSLRVLSDYYVRFLRYAHEVVTTVGQGIVAFIVNNSFISGPVHRGLRACLLQDFSDIYVLDLHGSVQPPEIKPPGVTDENIFATKTGVAVLILTRSGGKEKSSPQVHFYECWGTKEDKLAFLQDHDILSIPWQTFPGGHWGIEFNQFSLASVDSGAIDTYLTGISIRNIFVKKVMGVTTGRDALLVGFSKEELIQNIVAHHAALNLPPDLSPAEVECDIIPYNYRSLDFRFLYNRRGTINRDRHEVMQFLTGPTRVEGNLALLTERFIRATKLPHWNFIYATELVPDKSCISNQDNGHVYPLFIRGSKDPRPNIRSEVLDFLSKRYGRATTVEEVFYYILALLSTPKFQVRFSNLLILDYPRILFPESPANFEEIAVIGQGLARNFLLAADSPSTHFVKQSENNIAPEFNYEIQDVWYDASEGQAWYNATEYLQIEPELWETYLGYFHPLSDYLSARRGRSLDPAEVGHVDRIICALRRIHGIPEQLDTIFGRISSFLNCGELFATIIQAEFARQHAKRGTLFPPPFRKTLQDLNKHLYLPDERAVREILKNH